MAAKVKKKQPKKKQSRKKHSSGKKLDSPLVPGFVYSGVHCGIKGPGRDLAVIASEVPASVAGVFTRSTVVGAPVELSRSRVAGGIGRAVVVNSRISNVAMGARGMRDARAMTKVLSHEIGCPEEQVFVSSTGVIGEPLPMAKLRAGIADAVAKLSASGLRDAAEAIRTTDTFAKVSSRRVRVDRKWVTVVGIAKGSGMIEPNMATMLSFLTTDAAVSPAHLKRVLRAVADSTYNRVTIDGETSTSDSVLLLANGVAGNSTLRNAKSPGAASFEQAVLEVAEDLSRMLARDGEGATKLVTVNVRGAASPAQADLAARRIANSLLVKTAIFGRDPNWGRIIQTLGAGRLKLNLQKVEIDLCGARVFARGTSTGSAARRRAEAGLAEDEITIDVNLAAGRSKARIWTCDLSYDYIRINAEYTT